jgi:hypothetical protein
MSLLHIEQLAAQGTVEVTLRSRLSARSLQTPYLPSLAKFSLTHSHFLSCWAALTFRLGLANHAASSGVWYNLYPLGSLIAQLDAQYTVYTGIMSC